MKKVVSAILGVLGIAILAVIGMAMTKPDAIHVERSITAKAEPADVSLYTSDLEKANEWSPWEKKDPTMKRAYSEKKKGVGAWYTWEGNDDVGRGKQTVMAVEPHQTVHKLEFFEPFEDTADTTISWVKIGDKVKITWALDQKAEFMHKVMGVFMDMDAMLGPDFEAGLAMLKPLVESAATERMEAAEAAAAAEAATKAATEGLDDEDGEAEAEE